MFRQHIPPPRFFWLFFFSICSILLLSINVIEIYSPHIEIYDYAANSLLIQDAKSLKLLIGNYSYLGFNHPGPAILYVLAAGELIFFDWLHWVSSPFSGQLIAVAIYNAFWITLFTRLFYQISHSMRMSLLVLALFLGVMAIIDYRFFSSPWPPYLYFFPFAVFGLSLAILQKSRATSLAPLALSMGFLINGHVCFIIILGIMIVCGLSYNYFCIKGEPSVLSKAYILNYKKNLLIALGIFFLLLVPFIITTIREFPGPIADYLHYGQGHKPNSIAETKTFVAYYWGDSVFLWLSMSLCIFFWVFHQRYSIKGYYFSSLQSILIVILSATLSMLIYARYGVKYLFATYVGFFYYTIPAIFVSLFIASFLWKKIETKKNILLIIVLLSTTYAFLFYQHRVVWPLDQEKKYYYHPVVAELYTALNQQKEHGRLVLNFDYNYKGYPLWVTMIGLANHAKQQHNELFCINNFWQISFTKAMKCSKEESIYNKQFFVRHAEVISDYKPLFKFGEAAFYNVERFDLTQSSAISAKELVKSPIKRSLEQGWSSLEFDYIWTDGEQSSLVFNVEKNFSGELGLELVATLPSFIFVQKVDFYLDGKFLKQEEFSFKNNRKIVVLPIHSASGLVHLELRVKNPMPPRPYDNMRLGVALFNVTMKQP